MRKTLASRRKKFPRKLPNCGSVFVSNPSMYEKIGPPGYAIEKVGLKGYRLGDAQISTLHANFIVNLNDAKAKDVLKLIQIARKKFLTKLISLWTVKCDLFPQMDMYVAHEYNVKLFLKMS